MLGFLLAISLSFAFAFLYAAIIFWMDRYEQEPKRLLVGVFLWGALIAAFGALISQLVLSAGTLALTRSDAATELLSVSLYAPITEESLKGIAVLLVFLVFRSEFDSVVDGIVYAGITALGFAATENTLYLFSEFLDGGLAGLLHLFFLRVILTGWNHPMYTAFIGIGFAVARLNPSWLVKLSAPAVGWLIAVTIHALHNGLLTILGGAAACIVFPLDWLGWLFIFGMLLWAVQHERNWLVKQLKDEIALGVITPEQYRVATSSVARTGAWMRALGAGHFRATRQFYKLCTRLAFKKEQSTKFGDETGNAATIARVRAELTRRSPQI
ncbi:MAG: PrsW family intramembrane metalloprotease [Chloroflexi bacterium]|nr:PrsW family intramembrane metalloprotease [Chloroflexota bacterium]